MFVTVCSHVSFATVGDKLTELDVKLVKSLLYSAFSFVGTLVIFLYLYHFFFSEKKCKDTVFFVACVDLHKL